MERDRFRQYCSKWIAPKEVVDEWLDFPENAKEDYTSIDTDALYWYYIGKENEKIEIKHNAVCIMVAGGGFKSSPECVYAGNHEYSRHAEKIM
jgi:hypothetical protein